MFGLFRSAKITAATRRAITGYNSASLKQIDSTLAEDYCQNIEMVIKRNNELTERKFNAKLNNEVLALSALIGMGKVLYGRKEYDNALFMMEVANTYLGGTLQYSDKPLTPADMNAIGVMQEDLSHSIDWLLKNT